MNIHEGRGVVDMRLVPSSCVLTHSYFCAITLPLACYVLCPKLVSLYIKSVDRTLKKLRTSKGDYLIKQCFSSILRPFSK